MGARDWMCVADGARGVQRIRTPSSRLAAWRLLDDAHAREGRLRQDEEMVEIERGEKID